MTPSVILDEKTAGPAGRSPPFEPADRVLTNGVRLDIDVSRKPDGTAWLLTDLLGRAMGYVEDRAQGEFMIYPAGQAIETMQAMRRGPFRSLDAALAEIERFTRGTCRRVAEGVPPHADD